MKNAIPVIDISNIHKAFGENEVLKGVTLSVANGETLVILGRSGSGKSVTIKCLVGLVPVDKGVVKVFGTDIIKLNNRELNKLRVRIGFMFQNGALYDSMSVRQNLTFTLKHHTKDISKEAIEIQINEALENVGLIQAIDKMPAELSGGMRKRI